MDTRKNNKRTSNAETSPKIRPPPESPPRNQVQKTTRRKKNPPHQLIVGIGASAGGLEALRSVLKYLPIDADISYVIAQHLSPSYRSMLVELLARETTLQVIEITHGIKIEPRVIYVTPSSNHVKIKKNKLYLSSANEVGTPKPNINTFFTSLADELGEYSTGIILSGTGSDGALGIQRIRAAGGITIVQEPKTSKYDGMPKAAIETGFVDYIMQPQAIGPTLRKVFIHVVSGTRELNLATEPQTVVERITTLVKQKTGLDLSFYKEATLLRRLRRRMIATECENLESYLDFLLNHPKESENIKREMLISVTCFFRDPIAFKALGKFIEKQIVLKSDGDEYRAWVPGCATGEEAYTLALLISEILDQHNKRLTVRIFATDLDSNAIAKARRGVFPIQSLAEVSEDLLRKYFTRHDDTYRVNKSIRDQLIFSVHNLTRDPAFLRLDVISCRNVLIYLQATVQNTILDIFHVALATHGYLFLGKSETAHQYQKLFNPLDDKAHIYRRIGISNSAPLTEDSIPPSRAAYVKSVAPFVPRTRQSLAERMLQILHQGLIPPSVIVDSQMNLQHVIGDISEYIALPSGDFTVDLYRLAKRWIRVEIRSLFLKIQRENIPEINQTIRNKELLNPVKLTIINLPPQAEEQDLYLISFTSIKEVKEALEETHTGDTFSLDQQQQVFALEEQLATTREHLQTVIEELETSNEELQSLNEELQSANEELTSSNEELETANEELQSTNEELTTVNEELETKSQEISLLLSDIENVMETLVYPLIVLDSECRIKLFNTRAKNIIGATQSTIGQVIFTLPILVELGDLQTNIRSVLDTGLALEKQLIGTKCFLMRIEQYLDQTKECQGVVISFVENTEIMTAERHLLEYAERLKKAEHFANSTINALSKELCVINHEGTILSTNKAWQQFMSNNGGIFGTCGVGANYVSVCEAAAQNGDTQAAEFLVQLKGVLSGSITKFSMEYPCHSTNAKRWFICSVTAFEGSAPKYFVITHMDISSQKQQNELIQLQSRALDSSVNGIVIVDAEQADLPIVYVNKAFEEMTGYSHNEVYGQNCRFLQRKERDQPNLVKLRAAINEKRYTRVLLRNYRKDGSFFWNELSINPIHDENNNVTHFVGIQRNVTQMIDSENELKASLEREKLALSFAGIGTLEWDIRTSTLYCSDIHLKLLGLPEKTKKLKYEVFQGCIHEHDRPVFEDAIKNCMAGLDVLDVEYRVVWNDKTIHWLHTKGNIHHGLHRLPQNLVCLTQDITQRKQSEEQVRFVAHHDALTGLPNRSLLKDRLQIALNGAIRNHTKVAILFIDLDHFKNVNDCYGHHIGDLLLKEVSNRIRLAVRNTDTICRQGGDEFIVVIPNVLDYNEVSHIANKIMEIANRTYNIENNALHLTTSIGISLFPDDGDNIETLLRNADAAMYQSKGKGRNAFEFFTPELNKELSERSVITESLRYGIENGHLELYYQPEIDILTGHLVGIEALLRWNHPERGLILPDYFIGIAENSDIINSLGEWVLKKACLQNRIWQDQGLPKVPIAVNVSPIQFRQRNIIEKVSNALHESNLDPRYLELEITERTIMKDGDNSNELLKLFNRMGIRLTVDDFGTGYSSLTYLHRFPIDKIKIDRSFVHALPNDEDAATIVRAVINLARGMRLDVVAEGVELEEQLNFLREENCWAYQGYINSPALNATQIYDKISSMKQMS